MLNRHTCGIVIHYTVSEMLAVFPNVAYTFPIIVSVLRYLILSTFAVRCLLLSSLSSRTSSLVGSLASSMVFQFVCDAARRLLRSSDCFVYLNNSNMVAGNANAHAPRTEISITKHDIHTYIQTKNEMRSKISCLALRRPVTRKPTYAMVFRRCHVRPISRPILFSLKLPWSYIQCMI